MLVVIAIIAILAAMLLPALSAARERARAVHCVSNLKSNMTAMLMYADHNDELVVLYNQLNKGSTVLRASWADTMVEGGYLPDNPDGLACPSVLSKSIHYNDQSTSYRSKVYGTSSAPTSPMAFYNPFSILRSATGANSYACRAINTKAVELPSQLMILGDTYSKSLHAQAYGFIYVSGNYDTRLHLRHSGRFNIAILDGHVESLTQLEARAMKTSRYATATPTKGDYLNADIFCFYADGVTMNREPY